MNMLGLVGALHDIDAYRGRLCESCASWQSTPIGGGRQCRRDHESAGPEDGCDDWQPLQRRAPE